MGRFCILNFTQFSQNLILTMNYCFVKDCNRTSSCENIIQHTIKEQWIAIVKWKTDSPSRICSQHFENKCCRSLYGKKLWNNSVPIDLAVTRDFHVQVIKKDIIIPCLILKKLFNFSKIVRKGNEIQREMLHLQKRKKTWKKNCGRYT